MDKEGEGREGGDKLGENKKEGRYQRKWEVGGSESGWKVDGYDGKGGNCGDDDRGNGDSSDDDDDMESL